jgi:toxin ParE1/3/4
VSHKVELRPSALDDLKAIYDWIADEADGAIAAAYRNRILDACMRLADFPNRGSRREHLLPGLRAISFERRAMILYLIEGQIVVIVRVLHHGRDPELAFGGS